MGSIYSKTSRSKELCQGLRMGDHICARMINYDNVLGYFDHHAICLGTGREILALNLVNTDNTQADLLAKHQEGSLSLNTMANS